MIISIDIADRAYDVVIEKGCLSRAAGLLNLDRKCLIVTDDGVPSEYAESIASQCRESFVITLPQGESSKNMANLEHLLKAMLDLGFTRGDCVVAVGGGMVGDLGGFAAATYMRGIDFYNIPTTLLSQADSSIGGKTAVNLETAKNIVGAFWQPKAVLLDTNTLDTLPENQIASGMAEIIKAGMIADRELFEMIERVAPSYEDMLIRSLEVKKKVVEADEREGNLRRILNFGHTIGHGIESVTGMLHGHCVALGMIPMCSEDARKRLVPVLEKSGLPTSVSCDKDAVYDAVLSDKKMKGGKIGAVWVDEIGSCRIIETEPSEIRKRIEEL